MKKRMAWFLCVLMATVVLVGGIPSAVFASDLSAIQYPLPDSPKLVYAFPQSSTIAQVTPEYNDSPYYQGLQERTGVSIEFVHPTDFNLLFASLDLPDILFYNFASYPGGFSKAISDGIAVPLNPYLDAYAPDYQKVLLSNSDYWRSVTSLDNEVAGFAFIRGDDYLLTYNGMFMRNDWLKQLGMEVPQTAEELRAVLQAFKDEIGASAPMALTIGTLRDTGIGQGVLTTPFDLPRGNLYQIDGKVHFGYYEPQMKDVLAYLNDLYVSGLLTQDIGTINGDTVNANMMGSDTGLNIGSSGTIGNYFDTMLPKDPNYDIVGLGSLVKNRGDMPMSSHYDYPLAGYATIITPACKTPEIAAMYLNYNYTAEGQMYTNWGTEGVSYTIVDGAPKYTDTVVKFSGGMRQGLAQYAHPAINDCIVQDWRYQDEYMPYESQRQAYKAWAGSDVKQYALPNVLAVAAENLNEYSKLKSDIETYRNEMVIKFITGVEPLDNFDQFVSTLKAMGVERYIELTQLAFDAYLAR